MKKIAAVIVASLFLAGCLTLQISEKGISAGVSVQFPDFGKERSFDDGNGNPYTD